MPGNRSLDEFVIEERGDGSAAEEHQPDPAVDLDAGAPDEHLDADGPTIEPMAETLAWDVDGGPCAGCGQSAERRWREEAGLVGECCKEW